MLLPINASMGRVKPLFPNSNKASVNKNSNDWGGTNPFTSWTQPSWEHQSKRAGQAWHLLSPRCALTVEVLLQAPATVSVTLRSPHLLEGRALVTQPVPLTRRSENLRECSKHNEDYSLSFYLKSRDRDRETELSSAGTFPKRLQPKAGLGLSQEPRTQFSSRDPSTQVIACCLPECPTAGSWTGSRVAGTRIRHSNMGCCISRGVLTTVPNASPRKCFLTTRLEKSIWELVLWFSGLSIISTGETPCLLHCQVVIPRGQTGHINLGHYFPYGISKTRQRNSNTNCKKNI